MLWTRRLGPALAIGVVLLFSPPTTGGGVSVSPDRATTEARAAETGGHELRFRVANTGTEIDTYELICMGVGRVKCEDVKPTSVTLEPGRSATVRVTYGVKEAGAGLVRLIGFSESSLARDDGSYRIPVGGSQ